MSYKELLKNIDMNNNLDTPFVIEKTASSLNVWDTSKFVVGIKDHTEKKGNFDYEKVY